MKVDVRNLASCTFYIGEASEMIWEEWSKKKGASIEDVIYRMKHALFLECIPETFVALYRNELVGVVSLWNNDLCSRQDLFPWLATLYVKPEYRINGVGKQLQVAALKEAKRLGYNYVYLITDIDGYYERNGWEFLEYAPLEDGNRTRIYRHSL